MCQKVLHIALHKEDEPDLFDHRRGLEHFSDCAGRNWRSLFTRVPEGSSGNGREGDGAAAMAKGEQEGVAIAGGQQVAFVAVVLTVDRPDSMDDVLGEEEAGGRDRGFAGRQSLRICGAPQGFAGLSDRGPAGAMNGAIHSAASKQRSIGRIDDARDVLPCDVALENHHPAIQKCVHDDYNNVEGWPCFAIIFPTNHSASDAAPMTRAAA